jgi:phage terminase small subunit
VFEELHWIDSETQAVLDSLVESLPTAQALLLVNYCPEYQYGWGSKTSYTQPRLDPLPEASADTSLQDLLGPDLRLVSLTQLLIARTQSMARHASPAVEPAASHYRQALALAEELGMHPLQAHCHLGLGTLYSKGGQREPARAELAAALALYRAMGMTFWLPRAEAVLTQVE